MSDIVAKMRHQRVLEKIDALITERDNAATTERAEILKVLADPATGDAVDAALPTNSEVQIADVLAAVADLIAKRGGS